MSEPCKGIQDSLGFWVSRCGFRIQVLDPSLCQWNLDSGFPSLSGIPDSLSRIPIPKPRIPESIGKFSWIPDSTSKNFPDSRLRIPLYGANYVYYLSPSLASRTQ